MILNYECPIRTIRQPLMPFSVSDSRVRLRESPVNNLSSQGLREGSNSMLTSIFCNLVLSPRIWPAPLIQFSELTLKPVTPESFCSNLLNVTSFKATHFPFCDGVLLELPMPSRMRSMFRICGWGSIYIDNKKAVGGTLVNCEW